MIMFTIKISMDQESSKYCTGWQGTLYLFVN
jgi:hypothetical protein